jgi:hypothetical protein
MRTSSWEYSAESRAAQRLQLQELLPPLQQTTRIPSGKASGEKKRRGIRSMNEPSLLTWPRASQVEKTKPPAGRPWPRRACPELRGTRPSCHLLVLAVMDGRIERQGTWFGYAVGARDQWWKRVGGGNPVNRRRGEATLVLSMGCIKPGC